MARTTLVMLAALWGTSACSLISGLSEYELTGSASATGAGGAGGSGAASGGTGGLAGGGGVGGGGGTGGGSTTLAAWDGSMADPVSGTYDLPAWLSFESPSTNKTVQTGPESLRTGFDAHAARARSVDGVSWGLAVEGERTNRMVATRFAVGSWTALGGATTAPTTGPDETDVARLVTDQSTAEQGALAISFLAELGSTSTISTWVSTPNTNIFVAWLESNNFDTQSYASISPGTSWSRISFTGVENASASLLRVWPAFGPAGRTGEASIDFVSVEAGSYPSSVIITDPNLNPAPQTRMAEKLYVATPASVAPDGYFHVVLTFAPHYASGEQISEHDLLYIDDMNRLYLRTDDAVVLQEGGTDVLETSPLIWARDQAITVEVVSTTAERSLRVSVAGGADELVPGSPGAPFPLTGPLHLLGNTSGSQEGADLRAVAFYPPM